MVVIRAGLPEACHHRDCLRRSLGTTGPISVTPGAGMGEDWETVWNGGVERPDKGDTPRVSGVPHM